MSAARAAGPGAPSPSVNALGIAGSKAFDMARAADDGAAEALAEGDTALAQVKAFSPGEPVPDAMKPILEQAEASHQALVGYRSETRARVAETLQTLVEVTRLSVQPKPDPLRRDALEREALLSAHEAAVMAARARTETERLRAVVAEARAVGSVGGRPATAGASARSAPEAGPAAGVEVPNLVGAKLAAAVHDLAAAGLRLGGLAGPREGFIVKQVPEAGTRVPRQATVSVTLSTTAATTTVPPPR